MVLEMAIPFWPTSQAAGLIQTGKLAVDSAIEPYLISLVNDISFKGDVISIYHE
jgi:hypothetical protein